MNYSWKSELLYEKNIFQLQLHVLAPNLIYWKLPFDERECKNIFFVSLITLNKSYFLINENLRISFIFLASFSPEWYNFISWWWIEIIYMLMTRQREYSCKKVFLGSPKILFFFSLELLTFFLSSFSW